MATIVNVLLGWLIWVSVIIAGMIAAVAVPELQDFKANGSGSVTYNDALLLLMRDLLPNGVLGLAITGLLASFMAGMAANLSSFDTVVSYDLIERYLIKDKPDDFYLRTGRWVTVAGTLIGIYGIVLTILGLVQGHHGVDRHAHAKASWRR